MVGNMIEIPPVVRNKAVAHGAAAWLDDLPALIDDLADEWGLTVGASFDGGTEAYVTAVTRADGTPAVLKLLVPRGDAVTQHELTVLRHAAGEGCALLLEADVTRSALLIERLGPSMHDLALPLDERLPALTAAARRLWRPAAGLGLPTGAEKGRWLIESITRLWDQLDRPCSERVIEHAIACAERRIAAHDDERSVLVHGDVHQWNALQAPGGFKLVDPDGLRAEAEYDLGILMREDPEQLLAGDTAELTLERAALLASWTGLDTTAIWEWGVVERVSTGLLCRQIGLQPTGDEMLAVAELVAR